MKAFAFAIICTLALAACGGPLKPNPASQPNHCLTHPADCH